MDKTKVTKDFENNTLTIERAFDAPNIFVYKDYFSDADGTLNRSVSVMTITMEFIEEDGKTRLVTRGVVDTKEQLEQLINMDMIEGITSTLDKLDAFVTNQ